MQLNIPILCRLHLTWYIVFSTIQSSLFPFKYQVNGTLYLVFSYERKRYGLR